MAWTISDGTTTVGFAPKAGSITVEYYQTVGVFYPLRGATPFVQAGPQRAATISTPPWIVDDATDRDLLVALLGSGRVLTLTDDTAGTWQVRPVGAATVTVADTPDRDVKPRFEVAVELVAVA